MLVFATALISIEVVLCLANKHPDQAADQECGVMSGSASLIQGGYSVERETFPWIANIFTKYQQAVLFAGSGSLISDRVVICGANSVAYENYLKDTLNLNPEQSYIAYEGKNVKVILGSNYYKNANEPGSLSIDGVSKVMLHPNVTGTRPRIANIAMIFFNSPVEFSKYISPVCLGTKERTDLTFYAVGFGVDQSGSISGVKKYIPMVAVDEATCQKFFSDSLKKGKNGRFFCARGNGLETPCRYDKPLYVKVNERWFLQAMSSSFKVLKNRACGPRAPVLYEEVTQFTSWIEAEISVESKTKIY